MNILGAREHEQSGCGACLEGMAQPFPFTMAYQPIVHASGVFAYEALVRGPRGESAGSILAQVNETNLYQFDQACRVKALELAAALEPAALPTISINFFPGAVYKPETCIRKTLETADRVGMPLRNIIFEVTEHERVASREHLLNIFREYRRFGLQTAIDDFGAGFAGLDLLASFQPDIVKLDMALVRGIHERAASRTIVAALMTMCRDLGIRLIAEGIEEPSELAVLQDLGVELFQGYLFAKPTLEAFATPSLPDEISGPARLHMHQPAAQAKAARTV